MRRTRVEGPKRALYPQRGSRGLDEGGCLLGEAISAKSHRVARLAEDDHLCRGVRPDFGKYSTRASPPASASFRLRTMSSGGGEVDGVAGLVSATREN